ncbi:dTMP kinase [Vulcanisaeta sp. JCM 14467]|uniref:dTMP kinase n=1 Tax=Vulcanisaeta sp. JCM 14467 TaxID=1295370 RepID=UPI0020937DFE|nr:hypothetical protein [Vulcanisaeta sp. JCM 14467]
MAIEGIDGVGKSTVISMLRRRLEDSGYKVHVTAEPSQSPIGRLIRDWLLKPGSNVLIHPFTPCSSWLIGFSIIMAR